MRELAEVTSSSSSSLSSLLFSMYLSKREGKGFVFLLCRALSLILDHRRALVLVFVLIVVVVEALVLSRSFVRDLVFDFNRGVYSHSHTLTTLRTTDHTASTAIVDGLVVGVVVDALSIVVIGGTFPGSFLEVI